MGQQLSQVIYNIGEEQSISAARGDASGLAS